MLNEITLRALNVEDKDELAREYLNLSSASRRSRFIMPPSHLSRDWLVRLVDDVDGVNHIALVAVFEKDGEIVNVAIGRLIRFGHNRDVADVAVTVKDEFQGNGIGPFMVKELLKEAAKGTPVSVIETEIKVGNKSSEKMLSSVGDFSVTHSSQGSCSVKVLVDSSTYLV